MAINSAITVITTDPNVGDNFAYQSGKNKYTTNNKRITGIQKMLAMGNPRAILL